MGGKGNATNAKFITFFFDINNKVLCIGYVKKGLINACLIENNWICHCIYISLWKENIIRIVVMCIENGRGNQISWKTIDATILQTGEMKYYRVE